MRVGPYGVLQPIADAIKLILKEDITPTKADRWVFTAAPIISMVPALIVYAVIPFGPKVHLFGRDGNLFVVDVQTQAERKLTTDGGPTVLNGAADWVYGEEIFNRNGQAYWWSPDSTKITFLRLDETLVPNFTVVDDIPYEQKVEVTPYPKAGDPNPSVKLGIVAAAVWP